MAQSKTKSKKPRKRKSRKRSKADDDVVERLRRTQIDEGRKRMQDDEGLDADDDPAAGVMDELDRIAAEQAEMAEGAEMDPEDQGLDEEELLAHAEAEESEQDQDDEAAAEEHALAEEDPEDPPEPEEPEPEEVTDPEPKPEKKKPKKNKSSRRRSRPRESEEEMGKGNKGPKKGPYDDMTQEERLAHAQTLPEVEIRLLRRDRLTGRTQTVGRWPARDPVDIFDAENWIREWSGGGMYTMTVFDPNQRIHPLLTVNHDLPGDELEPLDVRKQKEQQSAPVQQAMPPQAAPVQAAAGGVAGPANIPSLGGPSMQQSSGPPTDPWGRPQTSSGANNGRAPYSPTGPRSRPSGLDDNFRAPPPRVLVPDDDDDESKGLARVLEKLIDQKTGSSGMDLLAQQQQMRWDQERREYEQRMDQERRDREKREEEARRRREEERREYEQRMEEREREFQRQREEDAKKWEREMATLRQQREEDRRLREQQEREAERHRREEEVRRREQEMQREREMHQQELARIQKEAEERATRERERFEMMMREQQRNAEESRKESERRWEEARRETELKMAKIEEESRRAQEQERQRAEEERRRHEEQLAAIRDQNQKAETTTLIEKLQQQQNQMMERFLAGQDSKREDPVMSRFLALQGEASARAAEQQNNLIQMMLANSNRDDSARNEYMRSLLEIVNPERQLGGYQQIGDMMTKNVSFMTELLKSGIVQQLGGGGQEGGGWSGIVDKLVDAVGGGVEAVMAMRSEQNAEQNAAARAAQLAAMRQAAGASPQGMAGAPQRPVAPPQAQRAAMPQPGQPAPRGLGGAPAQPAQPQRRVQLPQTPAQQPAQQPAPRPAPQPQPQEPPQAQPQPQPAPEPSGPAIPSPQPTEANKPLLKLRELLVDGAEPDEIAEFLYDYVSFLDRCDMLPDETREAIFGAPQEAVPRLLVTAVQLQPQPPLELTEPFVLAVIEKFVAILEDVGLLEQAQDAEAAPEDVQADSDAPVDEAVLEPAPEAEEPPDAEEEEPPPLLAQDDGAEDTPPEPA